MVIWLAFRMRQFTVNDHPYHAPQFIANLDSLSMMQALCHINYVYNQCFKVPVMILLQTVPRSIDLNKLEKELIDVTKKEHQVKTIEEC